jgi:hypothetical protein
VVSQPLGSELQEQEGEVKLRAPQIPDGKVNSPEELVKLATELSDEEVKKVGDIWVDLIVKYGTLTNTVENLEALRDEALNTFASQNILVTFDPAPCFYGEPPAIEIIGHVEGHDIHKYGFDHERKQWEVLRAMERGEDYLGQKEPINSRKTK